MFQLLNETAAIALSTNLASKMPSRAGSRVLLLAPVTDNSRDTQASNEPTARGSRSRARSRARSRSSRRTSRTRGPYSDSRSSSVATPISTAIESIAIDKDEEERVTIKSALYRKHNIRPNLYTSLYYLAFIAKYSLAINLNVITSEEFYRILKGIIYLTNYRNLERNLLQRINFEITIRFLLIGSIEQTKGPLVD